MLRRKIANYLELLRFSNVLTAVADVWMGMAVALGGFATPWISALLTASSVALYLGGMVLNDVFGAAEDAKDRSTRPIPSGRIPLRSAAWVGGGLIGVGLATAAAAAALTKHSMPLVIAVLLAVAIVVYDALPKRLLVKPWLMGVCRGLNVLLGMSVADTLLDARLYAIPIGAVTYIAGVTLFARSEAEISRRVSLARGAVVATVGILLMSVTPLLPPAQGGPELRVTILAWALLWGVTALLIGRRFVAALLQPTPRAVQGAIGNAIQGVIVIDAALAWGYAGQFWGLAILCLLPPTMLLARRIAQT